MHATHTPSFILPPTTNKRTKVCHAWSDDDDATKIPSLYNNVIHAHSRQLPPPTTANTMNSTALSTTARFFRSYKAHRRLVEKCKVCCPPPRRKFSTKEGLARFSSVAVEVEAEVEAPPPSPVHVTITTTAGMRMSAPNMNMNMNMNTDVQSAPTLLSDETQLVDSLLQHTESLINRNASNIIAFSGGVDSSLAAALVYRSFHNTSSSPKKGNVKAVLGVSASLPERQLRLARDVASTIGIDLIETSTTEGADETYIENKGDACFVCKNHLYSALTAVSEQARIIARNNDHQLEEVIMYNGTNADDTTDPTRLGLIAAKNFSVRSPLVHITKDEVRRASRHLNLPNWNFAASPCLRSRLALGVEATENHLRAVNMAEERVRDILGLDETMNLRVRMLAGQRAMVELGQEYFESGGDSKSGSRNTSSSIDDNTTSSSVLGAENLLREQGFDKYCKDLGFVGGIGVRPFKSGAVST